MKVIQKLDGPIVTKDIILDNSKVDTLMARDSKCLYFFPMSIPTSLVIRPKHIEASDLHCGCSHTPQNAGMEIGINKIEPFYRFYCKLMECNKNVNASVQSQVLY